MHRKGYQYTCCTNDSKEIQGTLSNEVNQKIADQL